MSEILININPNSKNSRIMVQKKMVSVYPVRYRNNQIEFLLIKRATPNYNWQCVSGSVGHTMGSFDHPADESPIECAERELFEETGYKPDLLIPFEPPKGFFVDDEGKGKVSLPHLRKMIRETRFYIFIAKIDQFQDPILNPSEHTDWIWCNFDRAYDKILWSIEKKGLRIVNDYLLKIVF